MVLYVDDEPGLRALALEELGQSGFDVITAADGIEALEQLEKHPEIQILFTDLRMPRMGGRELIINAQARNPRLRVALVSAFRDHALEFLAIDERCLVLAKPLGLDRLSQLASEMSATL